ncbi:MAG: 3'-5' exonuclease [Candidatus Omnitrophica bacterium]|nr:3'-5' exonuclease [Candidatus Omnitrophota bacterium]
MPKPIDEIEFTIFDTETTGLKPETGDRIVELAGLRVRGDEKIATFDTFINSGKEISAGAFAVNKITPQMLQDAPTAQEVLPGFLKFISGSCLCSYNAEFDLGFLNNELKLISLPKIDLVVFDLLPMARKLMPNETRYPLWLVAQRLGITLAQEHRAAADVELTWAVFRKFKAICREKGIIDFTNFSNLFANR